jgi:hypothetical protein
MGELFRVGEAAVHHHRPQRDQARLGEEQPWQVSSGIKPHEAALDQPLGGWWQLRLAGIGTAATP